MVQLVVVGDTHREDSTALTGRTAEAVADADLVVHTGDFTTERVLDAFYETCRRFEAVHGNNDTPGVRERLPASRTIAIPGTERRVVVVHGQEHTPTALSLLARQEAADLVVVGHSHRPGVEQLETALVVNPGSYSRPRQFQAAYAELDVTTETIAGRLLTPDGEPLERIQY
ncbi:MAG: metallophosphoesterase [Halobacteriales archaeon]|nr:metallophosphoesterase [Halobacteriales archaeon]